STNGGANWAENNGGPTEIDHRGIVSFTLDSTGVVYAGSDGGVYKTTNLGNQWKKVFTCDIDTNIYALATTSSGTVYFGSDDAGVYRSIDHGASWKQVTNGLPQYKVQRLLAAGEAIYAWTSDSGIYRSLDSGNSWYRFSIGLTSL